jgi:hypothetical protein
MIFGQIDPNQLVPATRRQDETEKPKDETANVLSQADALMRKHRVFVASEPSPVSQASTQTPMDDDLPVLTDAVDSPLAANKLEVITSDSSSKLRNLAMASIVNQWLEEVLPAAIQEVSEELAERLAANLSVKARLELTERLIRELDKPRA